MPAFDVTIDGKTYHVEVPDPGATPLQVVVDGQLFQVGFVGTETQAQAHFRRPASQPHALPDLPGVRAARPAHATGGANGGCVTAPMPGTIVSVTVAEGDVVDAGQVVCVLEAMKMKNPIRAGHAGTVDEIAVTVGQNVAYGDLLVGLR